MIKISNQDMAVTASMSKAAEASDASLFMASMQQAVARSGASENSSAGTSVKRGEELPRGAEKRDTEVKKAEKNDTSEDGAKTKKAEKDDSAKEVKNDDKEVKNDEEPAANEEAGAQAVKPEQQAAQDAQGNVQVNIAEIMPQQAEAQIGAVLQEEAAQTAGMDATNAEVPVSQEQLDFVGKVLGEIEQQVVGNEAERTEPVAVQAQSVTETTPDTQAQAEGDFQAAGYDLNREETKAKGTHETPTVHAFTQDNTANAAANASNAVTVELPDNAQAARQVVFDNLLSQVESAVSEEKSELYIRFKPDVFGGMAIRLSMTEEGLRAQIRTSDPTMRGMISSEIAQLTDTLRARGIDVVEMDVMYEQTANNEFLDQRSGQWQEQREQNGGGRTFAAEAGEDRAYEAAYERMIPVTDENAAGVVYDA